MGLSSDLLMDVDQSDIPLFPRLLPPLVQVDYCQVRRFPDLKLCQKQMPYSLP